ncbi:MFS multidrug transporter-like protein [Sporormia fimetaria CBS 119925]|uniref:MFS multidrug transporter-like protein n=1 Tax=Sporormia fimetaria CBS 119925 TaxID=1340428 RepID=A0A6A6VLB0_9PLEO|nr:MFS multidrug transporter-like protein [Sporormia fimetaria CBS 119925]
MASSRTPEEHTPLLRATSTSTVASTASKKSQPLLDDGEAASGDTPVTISRARGIVIGISMAVLVLIQAANFSILTTTQTAIAADLDAFEYVSWLTSSYLIAMSSLAPLMGRLSQVFSGRLCLFWSTVVISLGTLLTAMSDTFAMFIVGRVVTGVGAAGVMVVASIIVIQMASAKRRGLFLGFINSGITVGVSLGAVIAGALAPLIGWKPLFAMQAPLSLLTGFGLLWGIPKDYLNNDNEYSSHSIRKKLARLDYSGCVLLITTILLFLLGLSGPRILITPLVLSGLALPIFVLNEVYIARDPVIPVTVLRSRGTLLTCFATVGFMMARWCVLFYTPVFALSVRGWAPAKAGSILIPTNAGFATGGMLAGHFHIRRQGSFYVPSLVSMGLAPFTLLALAFLCTATSSPWLYVAVVFFNGFLAGAALNYTLVHVLHLTRPDVHPIVLSLVATFRGFAGSFGSAIGGGLFGRVLYKRLNEGFRDAGLGHPRRLIRQLLGSPALVSKQTGKAHDVAVGAYEDALRTLFLATVGLAAVMVLIQAGTGWTEPAKALDEDMSESTEDEDLRS